ncbi:hypothetical protein LCGC14_1873690 [marine sediment metagenome]|uniref:Uncharacterized protein n=1 Tax=marine sediment metagenome TaxID=412755 RepID=A0A0F9J2Z1_9ZZZZ
MRDYGHGKSRVKHIGNYELIVEFYNFQEARFYIYWKKNQVYYSGSDISISNNKQEVLELYRSLKTVKSIKQIINK